jgi:hypothetical protein
VVPSAIATAAVASSSLCSALLSLHSARGEDWSFGKGVEATGRTQTNGLAFRAHARG